jgi:FtsZ-binding cell division protein ZapB
MKLSELLAIYTNPEATDEQKSNALSQYEAAQTPAEDKGGEVEELRKSIERLESKNKELLSEKQTAKQAAEEAARKNMSVEELKADYEQRMEALKAEVEGSWSGKYDTVLKQLESNLVDNRALQLASELSSSPQAILPHIKSRIGFEVGENGFDVFVKGPDGKRTAASFDELKGEIASTDYLRGVLKPEFSNPAETEVKTTPAASAQRDLKSYKGDARSYLQDKLSEKLNSVGE